MKNFIAFVAFAMCSHRALAASSFLYPVSHQLKDSWSCDWNLVNPVAKSEKIVFSLPHQCPLNFFYASDEKTFYYLNEKTLVSVNWTDPTKRQSVPLPSDAIPAEGHSLGTAAIWKTKDTNKLRFAFFDSDPARVTTEVSKTDSFERKVTYKGKLLGEVSALGSAGAAVSYELGGETWKFLDAVATNSEACDTMGLDMVDTASHEGTFAPVSNDFMCRGDAACVAKEVSPELLKLIEKKFKTKAVYYEKLSQGWALVSAESSETDLSLPGFPAFLASPGKAELLSLVGLPITGTNAVSFSKSGDWFSVISDDAKGNHVIRIYSHQDPKPIKTIPKSEMQAMWIDGV